MNLSSPRASFYSAQKQGRRQVQIPAFMRHFHNLMLWFIPISGIPLFGFRMLRHARADFWQLLTSSSVPFKLHSKTFNSSHLLYLEFSDFPI